MLKIHNYIFIALVITLAACSNKKSNEKATSQDANATSSSEVCQLIYQPDSTTLTWTAYKTTEKIGVSGTFNALEINGVKSSRTIQSILENASFSIAIDSINSNNPDRDYKIRQFFFSNMLETESLTGNVTSVEGNQKLGKATVALQLNNKQKEVPFTYLLSGNQLKLTANIDLLDWNASAAIDSLNNQCYELHKGGDGISKLWPEVKIELVSTFKKDCQTPS